MKILKKHFSTIEYKARMPGESVFGGITKTLNEKKLSKEKTYPFNYAYSLFFYLTEQIIKAYEIGEKFKKVHGKLRRKSKKNRTSIIVILFGRSSVVKKYNIFQD